MKKSFRLFILSLVFIMCFSLFACQNTDNLGDTAPNTNISAATDTNPDNNSTPEADNILPNFESYEAAKALGLDTDYQTFQSIIGDDLAFALPSKNGCISIQEYEDSPFKTKFHEGNKYIFEARPDDGYYFEKWEAYNYLGEPIETKQQYYNSNRTTSNVYCNVLGDFYNYSTSIRFVRAIFTDNQQKLVDTFFVPIEQYGEDDGLIVSPLPDKIAKGTRIFQLVKPKKDYYITEWSSFYAAESDETILDTDISFGGNSVIGSLYTDDYKGLVFEYDEYCIATSNYLTFGVPSKFYIKTRKASEVSPIYLHVGHLYPYNMDGSQGFYFPEPQNLVNPSVIFADRNQPLYLEPRGQYMGDSFYGWYDWDGNLLTKNYVYTDLDFDEDILYLSMRFAELNEHLYEGFSEHTDYLRFNPINNATAWEVIYNYDNTEFIDVLTIPETYKGLPVTRIAERGFAKFWRRNTDNLDQWWFIQNHPQIGRLVVPSSIVEVGDYAFATVHKNVSTSSLATIDEDTDGDNWIDTITDITFEVEFLSINTKVTPYTFAQSGHKFINAWGQMEQVLNSLLHTYVSGVYALELNIYESDFHNSSGFYSLEKPYTINLSKQLFEESDGKMYFSLLHEFRHFMQFVCVGAVEGASLKVDLGTLYSGMVQDNLDNYISSEQSYFDYIYQFVEQDANAFAYAYFGYKISHASIIISA